MKYNIFNRKIFAAFSAAIITFYSSVHFLPCKNSNVFAKENNLYVGYSNISESYSTVQSAVDAAERINPSSESERIIIPINIRIAHIPDVMIRIDKIEDLNSSNSSDFI